jgi:putative ubiquitin-RnfH superfamily antitoxin RatB of RatAB toxin-antitoxin module
VTLRVAVAWASPVAQDVVELDLADGATVADALAACDALARAGVEAAAAGYAIFGQRAHPTTPLADGDRVEVTRPLVADPKLARRDRARSRPLPVSAKPPRRRRRR